MILRGNVVRKLKISTESKSSKVKLIRKPAGFTKLAHYKPHIPYVTETKKYIIKTVENWEELKKVLKLRYEIFYSESHKRKRFRTIDVDKFDRMCDHLIIIDKETNCFVGTYRLNSSLFNKRFYSSTEFKIDAVLALEGNKLELGRACIHKDYRNSLVIATLWKTVIEYMKKTDTRYVFGCSSVKTTDINEILQYHYSFIDMNVHNFDVPVIPRLKHRIKGFKRRFAAFSKAAQKSPSSETCVMPPLLRFYFKAGATICGEPAIDRHFGCTDFFTLIDVKNMNKNVEEKLLKK